MDRSTRTRDRGGPHCCWDGPSYYDSSALEYGRRGVAYVWAAPESALRSSRGMSMGVHGSQETVLVFEHGKEVDSIRRTVFKGCFLKMYPHAAGFINYERAIAVLHRGPDDVLFMERTEPLIRGYHPLARVRN